jgi:phage terminase Nu1 subunit (DNA packaging protein)
MNDETQTVNASELAKMLGVSDRQIYKLAARGAVSKHGRRFVLAESIRLYILHVQGKDENLSTIDALRIEQAKLAAARRMVIEQDVIPADRIAGSWDRILRVVRSAVLAIPSRARFELPHLSASDAEVLAQICRSHPPTKATEFSLSDRADVCSEITRVLEGATISDLDEFLDTITVLSHGGYKKGQYTQIAREVVEIIRLRGLYNSEPRWDKTLDMICRLWQSERSYIHDNNILARRRAWRSKSLVG